MRYTGVLFLALFVSPFAFAHGKPVTLPLYLICEQVDGKINGWTDVHVMSFEGNGGDAAEPEGVYRRFSKHQHPQDGEIRADEGIGRAILSETFMPGQYDVNAVATLSGPTGGTFPYFVMGGRLAVSTDPCASLLSQVHTMKRSVTFIPNTHNISCRSVDKATASKLFP